MKVSPQLSDFVEISKDNLNEKRPLKMDLFLYLKENKTIILIRKRGETPDKETLNKLQTTDTAIPLVRKTDISLLSEGAVQDILNTFEKSGTVNSPDIQMAAVSILKTLDALNESGDVKQDKTSSANVQKFVQNIVRQIEKTPVVFCYEKVLKQIDSTFLSDLDKHNLDVSTLAVLLLLTEGETSPTEISEVALAGLFHDVGLAALSPTLQQKHLAGIEELNQFEMLEYQKHMALSASLLCPVRARSTVKA